MKVGSSPLARGLRSSRRRCWSRRRIIPARAGFTPCSPWTPPRPGDHPRSRGVYYVGGDTTSGVSGSSPLARGLPRSRALRCAGPGIIPARAGFTSTIMAAKASLSDHPRSRGVYDSPGIIPARAGGSSPLARGLLEVQVPDGLDAGIIPARAGFTPRGDGRLVLAGDHPRSRGVYSSSSNLLSFYAGSSPLARGLHLLSFYAFDRMWIIPARAGFTPPAAIFNRLLQDHPRSRGVYVELAFHAGLKRGSSPLARGLHLRILGIPTNP